jgi:hypothetical protein
MRLTKASLINRRIKKYAGGSTAARPYETGEHRSIFVHKKETGYDLSFKGYMARNLQAPRPHKYDEQNLGLPPISCSWMT